MHRICKNTEREKEMTFGAQALSINTTALEKNLPNIANNPAIAGQTPATYDGFGLKANSANPNDIAYFFADYAKDNTNATGVNLVLNSENASSGGYKLAQDIVTWAGDNGYLEESELAAWAEEIGFTGDIRDVMTTMSEMDKWLYGDTTLELVSDNEVPQETIPEETAPEETIPEETVPGETTEQEDALSDYRAADIAAREAKKNKFNAFVDLIASWFKIG